MREVFEAIGTTWDIDTVNSKLAKDTEIMLFQEIRDRIETFDQTYSRFRSDSLISKIFKKPGMYHFPSDARSLFSLYKQLYTLTDGAFTPLIGKALSDAGYDHTYSLVPKPLNPPLPWEKAMVYAEQTLTTQAHVLLDFGAAGKGYLVDIVGEICKKYKLQVFCIDAGGDVKFLGNTPLQIGLEHPEDPTKIIGVAEISNKSICGSSGNRRKWSNYHHILHPKTLTSPTGLLATWVVADTTLLADALATCLYFVPAQKLLEHFDFSYLKLLPDYTFEKSTDFPAQLYTQKFSL
jgi:thiamine biosynthesis lipoprotein